LRRRARSRIATIIAPPISRPGTIPPRNSAPTETSARLPYMTKGILGGMIGPTVQEAQVSAAAKRVL
jgi:hypothetical protein